MAAEAEIVITMGCAVDESCPAVFLPSDDRGLEDPAGKPIVTVRRIRDDVEERVRELLGDLASR